MAISLLFSGALYAVSAREIDRGFREQGVLIEGFPYSDGVFTPRIKRELRDSREELNTEAKARVLSNLLIANVGILILSGGLSYLLAKRSLEPIEEAHRSLEQFTADASHEIRTPIAAMRSEIEVALLDPKLTIKEARGVLQSNLEELETLTQLTSGMLSLARLEGLDVHMMPLSLKSSLQKTVDRVLAANDHTDVGVNLDAVPKAAKVQGDRMLLEQVLVAVLDNAVKYAAPKSSVVVSATTQKGAVRMTITNTGKGIGPADVPYVFDRFYRADRSRTKKGSGLGLAIARELTEAMGGTIDISSKPDNDTTVSLVLKQAA